MRTPLSPSRTVRFEDARLETLVVTLGECAPPKLADELHKMLGGRPDVFSGQSLVLDFGFMDELPGRIDWAGLMSLFRRYRLQPIGVRDLPEALEAGARQAGLAILGPQGFAAAGPAQPAGDDPTPAPSALPPVGAGTMIIDRPVRSGQQIYARGGDLVLLNGMSHGAEAIADGSIHCYGPLRGRVLAGAQGRTDTRILTTHFCADLVAVAGVYRTFDAGIPATLSNKPAQVRLAGSDEAQNLLIEPLSLD